MSTPTPSSHPHQPGAKHPTYANHAVSTPAAHLTTPSSSTPRSVPSPAVLRNTAGKTPMTGNASKLSVDSRGAVLMAPSLSQMSTGSGMSGTVGGNNAGVGLGVMGAGGMMGLGTSPAVNMLGFASPAALGALDLSTPAMLDAAAAAGAQGMNVSLSDLGISGAKRNEDEERRARLEGVLGKIQGKRKRVGGMGRLSEEGVRRVGKWAGFAEDVDPKTEGPEFEGERTITMAGSSALLIDYTFKDNLPRTINVSFSSENKAVTAYEPAAAKVLQQDLTPSPGIPAINTKLDRFAANLEILAGLDKLGINGQLNCFEAISGIYASLQRLYEYEKRAALELMEAKRTDAHILAETEVLCKQSGRPRMHARRRIGLGLDFWMEQRLVQPPAVKPDSKASDGSQMDMDLDQTRRDMDKHIYALQIGAESSSPDLYPSLRVASSWLSDRVVKPAEESTDPADLLSGKPVVDWLDPPSTYVSETNQQPDAMAIDNTPSQQKLPNARFVARAEPPIVMPWTVAGELLQSVGVEMPGMVTGTYETMLLRADDQQHSTNMNAVGPASTAGSSTLVIDNQGKEADAQHFNSLFVPKPDFAFTLEDIPFSHPRQLIQLLPVLRQWACFGSLLRNTFKDAVAGLAAASSNTPAQTQHPIVDGHEEKQFSLSDLLTPPPEDEGAHPPQPLPVDITLVTLPIPTLNIIFPMPSQIVPLANVTIQVMSDAQIVVANHNLSGAEHHEPSAGADATALEMAKALDVCGDLSMWIEWVRLRYSGRP